MKIIHCADIHLDSKMSANLTKEKARERKTELLTTFQNMVAYGAEQGVSAIIIAGDLFDTKNVSATARNVVKDLIQGHPQIAFYYLQGNHDEGSFTSSLSELPENLHLFGNNWTSYELSGTENTSGKGVAVTGVELTPENSGSIYHTLSLDADQCNIVVLHGQESEYSARDKAEIIHLTALKNKGIDYLALGHIHRPSSFCDGRARYCGSPFPLSFDEQYPHSVSLVTIAAHGAMPEVREVDIRVPVPVMSVPRAPKPLEEVLETLRRLPDGHGAYLRVNLEIEDFIPGNARKTIDDAIVDKNYRFCGINGVRARRRGGDAGAPQQLTTDQIREMDPLEVADQYYQKKYQIALPERFSKCLKEIISDMEDAES